MATRIVASFEAQQVFPRGLGIDWAKKDVADDVRELEVVLRSSPRILSRISAEDLAALRLAACMTHLWGTTPKAAGLSMDLPTAFDATTAARMLVFHGNFLRIRASLRHAGFRTVIVSGSNDERQCDGCHRIVGQYAIDHVPELPYEGCTSENGCRCLLVAGKT
jgi:hypothetical protein